MATRRIISGRNLRIACQSENNANSRIRKDNNSGLKGVCWLKRDKKWRATIGIDGKSRSFGNSDCPAAASFAYQIEADKAFGEFARGL